MPKQSCLYWKVIQKKGPYIPSPTSKREVCLERNQYKRSTFHHQYQKVRCVYWKETHKRDLTFHHQHQKERCVWKETNTSNIKKKPIQANHIPRPISHQSFVKKWGWADFGDGIWIAMSKSEVSIEKWGVFIEKRPIEERCVYWTETHKSEVRLLKKDP